MQIQVSIPKASDMYKLCQTSRAHDALDKAVAGFAKHIACSVNQRSEAGHDTCVFQVRQEHMAYNEYLVLLTEVLTSAPFSYTLVSKYDLETEKGIVTIVVLGWGTRKQVPPRYLGDRG